MFNNILGKSKKESNEDSNCQEISEKISKMNLTDMRIYVNDKLNDFKVSEDGLSEIMRRLTSKNANGKRFIESDAMDSKIKKAFDLVILISKNKKMTIVTAELIQTFIEMYRDLIVKFDKDYKQIYASLLKDSLNNSIDIIASMAEINKKTKVLGK